MEVVLKHILKPAILIVCMALSLPQLNIAAALAQAQPDAGTLLQQQRQPAVNLPERLPSDSEKKDTLAPLKDTGVKVLIKGFRFTGHEGIAEDSELQGIVREFIGRELGFSDLQKVARTVTTYLKEKKGYLLARAYLPKQDITAGMIEIAVVAGRIDGQVNIRIKDAKRINQTLLEAIAGRVLPADAAARMDRLEEAVLLMNDLPGIEASASLEPGKTPGTTRVIVNATEGPLLHGVVSADNYGDRYTGAARGSVQASAYDPFGRGDQMTVGYTGADRLNNLHVAYALPLGATGWTWDTSYTGLNYRLGKEIGDLNAEGKANTVNTGLNYTLLRTRKASIWTGLGGEYLMMEDEANGQKTRDRKLFVGNASLSGSFFDTFGGGGLTSVSLILTGGDVDLSGLDSYHQSDDAGAGTSGTFIRASYLIARLQRLTRQTALFTSVRGQLASNNLDSSQKFILGGSTGVRAYPTGEGPGDEGHMLTVEARYDLPYTPAWAATQLVGFFDTGWVRLHNNPWPGSLTSPDGRNDYVLSGGGVGITMGKAGLYSLRASYAHKIGPNDGCSLTGKDSDNTDHSGRYWLQLIVWL